MGRKTNLNSLLHVCQSAPGNSDARSLVEQGCTLVADVLQIHPSSEDKRRFEALLDAGAHLEAVLSVLPQDWGYMLSRGMNGKRIASAMAPFSMEDVPVEAEDEALALLGAIAAVLAPPPLTSFR